MQLGTKSASVSKAVKIHLTTNSKLAHQPTSFLFNLYKSVKDYRAELLVASQPCSSFRKCSPVKCWIAIFHTFCTVCKVPSFRGVSISQSIFSFLCPDWAQFKQAAGKASGLQRRSQSDINPLIKASVSMLISTFVKANNSRCKQAASPPTSRLGRWAT